MCVIKLYQVSIIVCVHVDFIQLQYELNILLSRYIDKHLNCVKIYSLRSTSEYGTETMIVTFENR